jgi:hypothetical protein
MSEQGDTLWRLEYQEKEIRRLIAMMCDVENDRVWSVRVPDGKPASMVYIGYAPTSEKRYNTYPSADALPDWVKDRIAVLRMLPPKPGESVVRDVGRRVDVTTYWVVEPKQGE